MPDPVVSSILATSTITERPGNSEVKDAPNTAIPREEQALLNKIILNKESAEDFQLRRHPDWVQNYQLYRDKVIIDRFAQRQSVNIPITKETVNTTLSRIDDPPKIVFEARSNNEDRNIVINAMWDDFYKKNRLSVQDMVDKKQNCLYGRSHFAFNFRGDQLVTSLVDPFDFLVDRYVDPLDLNTAHYVGRTHIYKTYNEIIDNPLYDKEAKRQIMTWCNDESNYIILEQNSNTRYRSNKRLQSLGDTTINQPVVGENWIELTVNFMKLYDKSKKEWFIHYIVSAQDSIILCNKRLIDLLNINFYPFSSWGSDIEALDFYSDGVVDIIRPVNKVMNVWLSQLVENRYLRNANPILYDATNRDFTPQTYDIRPFGWYPLPGRPQDVMQRMEIPDLSESLDEMQFLISVAERATATTANIKGAANSSTITLGEVKIAQENALERINSMSVFYHELWKQNADIWAKITLANADKIANFKLWKKGANSQWYGRDINVSTLVDKEGYEIQAMTSSEQTQKTNEQVQLIAAVASQMPNNALLKKEKNMKLISMLKLDPQKEKAIMDEEEKAYEQAQKEPSMPMTPGMEQPQGMPNGAPQPANTLLPMGK